MHFRNRNVIDVHKISKLDTRGQILIIGIAYAELSAIVQSRTPDLFIFGNKEDTLRTGPNAEQTHDIAISFDRNDELILINDLGGSIAELAKVIPTTGIDRSILEQYVGGFLDCLQRRYSHIHCHGDPYILSVGVSTQLAILITSREVNDILGHEKRVTVTSRDARHGRQIIQLGRVGYRWLPPKSQLTHSIGPTAVDGSILEEEQCVLATNRHIDNFALDRYLLRYHSVYIIA
mmetsp:Transcript_2636/g.5682  ORF Transcript_2636/g.5682 Transcript_2636/m.5682 type:complete len:234 (+) Transcript_2636:652-1353(+)